MAKASNFFTLVELIGSNLQATHALHELIEPEHLLSGGFGRRRKAIGK
jgi:hypothetical protein